MTPMAANEWIEGSKADGGQTLYTVIALALRNNDLGIEFLLRISDPSSSIYGQQWTAKEVAQTVRPEPEGLRRVLKWLETSGISSSRVGRSHSGGQLRLNLTVDEAGQLCRRGSIVSLGEELERHASRASAIICRSLLLDTSITLAYLVRYHHPRLLLDGWEAGCNRILRLIMAPRS